MEPLYILYVLLVLLINFKWDKYFVKVIILHMTTSSSTPHNLALQYLLSLYNGEFPMGGLFSTSFPWPYEYIEKGRGWPADQHWLLISISVIKSAIHESRNTTPHHIHIYDRPCQTLSEMHIL